MSNLRGPSRHNLKFTEKSPGQISAELSIPTHVEFCFRNCREYLSHRLDKHGGGWWCCCQYLQQLRWIPASKYLPQSWQNIGGWNRSNPVRAPATFLFPGQRGWCQERMATPGQVRVPWRTFTRGCCFRTKNRMDSLQLKIFAQKCAIGPDMSLPLQMQAKIFSCIFCSKDVKPSYLGFSEFLLLWTRQQIRTGTNKLGACSRASVDETFFWSFQITLQQMRQKGYPGATDLANMFHCYAKTAQDTGLQNGQMNKGLRTFREWLAENTSRVRAILENRWLSVLFQRWSE